MHSSTATSCSLKFPRCADLLLHRNTSRVFLVHLTNNMVKRALKSGLSLLDALDQSFMPSEPPQPSEIENTPLGRNPLQTPDIRQFFDAGGSSQKARALEIERLKACTQNSLF